MREKRGQKFANNINSCVVAKIQNQTHVEEFTLSSKSRKQWSEIISESATRFSLFLRGNKVDSDEWFLETCQSVGTIVGPSARY